MEIDKIEAFDYMPHLFEEWRDNHETAVFGCCS